MKNFFTGWLKQRSSAW